MNSQSITVGYYPKSFVEVLKSEWLWWLSGAIISFELASILMTGWPSGILPELSYPYRYEGDVLSHAWLALRAIEGWIFDNPRSGYPFGSNFLDYPGSDAGNLLLLKIIGLISGHYYSALNLFFLLSFSAVFISAFCSLRAFGLSIALSFTASLLFAFLPFHFHRFSHIFYTWYFIVPIFFYLCYSFYESRWFYFSKMSWLKKIIILLFVSIMLASFGVYYAFFGIIMLTICAIMIFIRSGNFRSIIDPVIVISFVSFGIFLNTLPNIVNQYTNGSNIEVAQRSPQESEIYGLKLTQLVLPRADHRISRLAAVTQRYNQTAPLINENVTSTLGIIGTIGFMSLFFILLMALSGRQIDTRLNLLAMLTIMLFFVGTIGGLGSLFALSVTPLIRSWNRISVFIAFGAIAAFFIILQLIIIRYFSIERAKFLFIILAFFLGWIGLYDQTVPACLSCNVQHKTNFEMDRDFVAQIEKSIPSGGAVYQLPYMPFPEVAPLYRLSTYALLSGFLHSKDLHWNYGGMKGRDGDLFYRALAKEPIEKQLEVIKKMGFSGIYIDRRGFNDNANELIKNLSVLLGDKPLLQRADGQIVFFRIANSPKVDLTGLNSFEIMRKVGYIVDKLGVRYPASYHDGIDFTRPNWPEFIRNVSGISGYEPWGRWSDANLNQCIKFDFFDPLPNRFVLVLSAVPFGRNGEQTVSIRIGSQIQKVIIRRGELPIRLSFDLGNDRVYSIEFLPQNPVSPKEMGLSEDTRKLGIGFVRLQFEY